jgi:TonB family protein
VGLIGNSSELSLQDLVQMKALSRGTCRIQVRGPRGPGVMYVSEGAVVHAEYDGREGLPAASALLAEEQVDYRVTSDVDVPPPSMKVAASALILQTAVQVDEHRRAASAVAAPAGEPAAPATSRGRHARRLLGAVAGGLGVAALVAFAAFARVTVSPNEASANPPVPVPEARPREPIEANRLTGARDALPVLLSGELPRTPSPDLALRPTVIVRVLVDEGGAVAQAAIYQPRAELAGFEQAALSAVKGFRFQPARREGQPVAAWINWPVDFL